MQQCKRNLKPSRLEKHPDPERIQAQPNLLHSYEKLINRWRTGLSSCGHAIGYCSQKTSAPQMSKRIYPISWGTCPLFYVSWSFFANRHLVIAWQLPSTSKSALGYIKHRRFLNPLRFRSRTKTSTNRHQPLKPSLYNKPSTLVPVTCLPSSLVCMLLQLASTRTKLPLYDR